LELNPPMSPAERCRREIAAIEAELLAGSPDVMGLCLALSDWSAELWILQNGNRGIAGTDGLQRAEVPATRKTGTTGAE
jgi:hypothetical protein